MVPTGEQEQEQNQEQQDQQDQQVAPPVPVVEPKVLRSRSRARSDGDAEPSTASPEEEQEQEQEQEQQLRRPARGRRGRKSNPDAPLDNRERIKRRVKYLLIKMRVDQNLLDAYSGEGWKGQSREKIRPERELQRAEAHILRCKLDIREAVHELDDMGLEGSLADDLFDSEGRIYHEEIFCAKCKSVDSHIENDIILCDGACNRGFHQFCLDPPLLTKDIPPGDEGWLCPVCECKMDCVELINAEFGSKYEVENSWEDFFSKEALIAAGGGTGDRAAGEWPSSDSEDDDYDPEAGEKRANSEEEGESEDGDSKEGGDEKADSEDEEDSDYNVEDGEGREGGEDWEGCENEEDSDSGSDFREDKDKESPGSSDEEEEEEVPSNLTNLKKLARKRKGKRRRKEESSKEESESSDSSGSDASDVSFFDEFKDGGPKLGSRRRDSQAQQSASDEEAIVIEGKRQRQALDYKKLHDEMFGDADDGDEGSEDEDFGPKRRRRRSVSDEPSRPRPPRVRRRKVKTPAGDAGKGVEADGVQTSGGDAPEGVEAVDMQTSGGDAPKGVEAVDMQTSCGDAPKGIDAAGGGDASKRVDSDGVQTPGGAGTKVADADDVTRDLPSGSQVDGAGDTPGGDREKRMWRRLPDAAVEGLRRVVAVNALPSKPQKEALAAQLGLSFAQVHGWFKNQRHQALRKGLVTPKRPHLVASSSKGMNAAAAANSASPQNLKTLNTDFTEKLDVVQIRLRELEKSLDLFAKETIEGADGRAAVESQNTYELGGIGLPANGNHVVYVPAVEVTENATC